MTTLLALAISLSLPARFARAQFATGLYVTNTTAGGASTGTGVPPTKIHGVLGISKAYTTRVGEGPFPTELDGAAAELLRMRGNEFGSVTGRPRRCGAAPTASSTPSGSR